MCSLPNIQARDLEELSQRRKREMKKTKAKPAKIIIPGYLSVKRARARMTSKVFRKPK